MAVTSTHAQSQQVRFSVRDDRIILFLLLLVCVLMTPLQCLLLLRRLLLVALILPGCFCCPFNLGYLFTKRRLLCQITHHTHKGPPSPRPPNCYTRHPPISAAAATTAARPPAAPAPGGSPPRLPPRRCQRRRGRPGARRRRRGPRGAGRAGRRSAPPGACWCRRPCGRSRSPAAPCGRAPVCYMFRGTCQYRNQTDNRASTQPSQAKPSRATARTCW